MNLHDGGISEDAPFPGEQIPPPPEQPDLPRNPPWRIWEGLLLLGLFLLAQLIASGIAAWLVYQFAPGDLGSDERELERVLFTLPPALAVSYLAGWLAVYWLVVKRHRRPFRQALGLGTYSPARLLFPFCGGMALQLATVILVALHPPADDHQFAFDIFLHSGAAPLILFFVIAVVLAPLMEEVMFRGVLLPALRLRFGFPVAALAVTTLFTAMHAFQTGAYWPALLGIGVCGWLLAWMRERTGRLWHSVAFHVGFNFMAFLPIIFLDLLA